ncbi:Prophage endopeptidase tail [Macrococcoides canis]|uniref:Prophage endopeptidase tail n=1 Tax=Macrococcoides canis TaxID=1855823 RepID=A0A1W7ACD8_9STAP|nr:phage tail spike protein [Macrococcus canis]ARQ07279.1 Prophage endopeptidase tail [Macrococcus canis]
MLIITDLKGISHALLANKTIKKELNGDHTIELEVHQQKNNSLDLNTISEMWTVTYKNIDYKIVYVDKITKGNSFYLKLRGKPLFYDDFAMQVIHFRKDGSMTAVDAFNYIFSNSGYSYTLVNSRAATTWDGFGNGQSRLDLFKQAIDKYSLEFYIQGKTIYLVDAVGSDTNFLYKYKLNASNVSKSIDATSYFTHIKGFGNYKDKGDKQSYLTDAKLKLEYTHPLASVVGVREAPPIVDGRVTQQVTLENMMHSAIDNSLNVTVKATLHDLRKQGYAHGIPQLGDRTFLLDERIDLKQEIRVYGLEEHYDERDVLKDCSVDFGSQSIRKRYKSNITAITNAMQKVLEGRLELPFNVLSGVAKDMVSKIQSASTELIFENGIEAWSKDNPNIGLILNSAGLYITADGGKTAQLAMTGEGIVANSITSGQILTHLVRVVGTEGLFYIDGDVAKWVDASNPNRYTEIRPEGAYFKNGSITIETSSGRKVIENGYVRGNKAVSETLPRTFGPHVTQGDGEFSKNYIVTTSDNYESCAFYTVSHEARYLRTTVTLNTLSSSNALRARLREGSKYSTEARITSSDVREGIEYGTPLIYDLGEPLDYSSTRFIYVEFRLEGTGTGGIRINTREQTDFV